MHQITVPLVKLNETYTMRTRGKLSRVGGLYRLALELGENTTLTIGALGTFNFSPGHYVYVGSARSGVVSRVSRHLQADISIHWHIDHIVQYMDALAYQILPKPAFTECQLADHCVDHPGTVRFPPRFGSSDCRCGGHLIYSAARPPWVPII